MGDTWILQFVEQSPNRKLNMLTLLRIARLIRLVRVVRLMRMFRGVYVTVMAFKDAVANIGYIGILMVGSLYICAIFTTSTIGRDEQLREMDMGGYTGAERFGT